MSAYDGSIRINTKLNTAGFDIGAKRLYENARQSFAKIGRLVAGALSITALVKFGKEAIQLSSDLAEVQNVVDTAFGDMTYKMEQFADTAVDTYGMSKLTAKEMGSLFASMGRGMGQSLDAATDGAVELTGRLGDVASFYNLTLERAKTLGKAIYTGETEPLKDIGVVMTETNLSTYALSKGYSKLYKEMSATEKLEVRQKFFLEQTTLAAGDFVKTQDSWSNQTKLLSERWKEFMTSVGNTLTTVLTPALALLNSIVAALTNVAQAIEQVTNKLFGKTTKAANSSAAASKDAADAMIDYGESIAEADEKASGSQASFDDLNVLQKKETSSSSTSAGKSNGITDISSTVKDAEEAEEELTGLAKRIKEAIDTDDWGDIGSSISEKITDSLRDIDWQEIYENAEDFGSGFASFLNGLITPELFNEVGSTIASSLNTAIKTALGFGTEFDFENLGLSIAAGVNGFFEDFDFADLADTVDVWVQGLWLTIKTAIFGDENGEGGIDWSHLLDGLKEFIENLDEDTIKILIGLKVLKAFGRRVASAISSAIGVVNVKLSKVIIKLGAVVIAAEAGFSVGKLIGEYLFPDDAEYYENFNMTDFFDAVKESIENGTLWEDIKGTFESMWDELLSDDKFGLVDLADAVIKAFKDLPETIKTNVKDIKKHLNAFVTNIQEIPGQLKEAFDNAKEKVAEFKDNIVGKFDTIREKVNSKVENMRNKIKTHLSKFWSDSKENIAEFKDNLADKFSSIKEKTSTKIEGMRENIKTHLSNFWSDSKENVVAFKDNLVEKFDSIKEKAGSKFESARENIKTHLSNLWEDSKEKITDFKDKLAEKFEAIRDNVVSPVRKMRDSVKSAFRSMWTGVKDIINTMLEGIEKFANGMINGVNAVIDGLNKLSFDVKNPFTGEEYKMGVSIKHIKEVEIPRLATGGITTGSTLARIGEAGREAVLPLENNLQYLDKFADRIARKIPKANNGPVYLQIDGATFARLLNPYSKAEQARIGLSFT